MSKVNRNEPVPVPKGGRVYANGRIVNITVDAHKKRRKTIIGWVCNPDKVKEEVRSRFPNGTQFMYPNEEYYNRYPDAYLEFNPNGGQQLRKHHLVIGLYALILAIAIKIGIYKILLNTYTALEVNAILDYAMYSILYRSDDCHTFTELMQNYVLFSIVPYSDSWYSKFFLEKMSEDKNHKCREEWLDYVIETYEIKEVCASSDGTNVNCEAKNNKLAVHGKAKSNIYIEVVGLIWIVVAEGDHKGMPVSYSCNVGSMPDSTQMQGMLAFWKNHNVHVKIAVFDRGFPNDDMLHALEHDHIPYQAMLKNKNEGFKTLFEEFGTDLILKVKYTLPSYGMRGITREGVRPYKNTDLQICGGLFYDSINGPQRVAKLSHSVYSEQVKLQEQLDKIMAKQIEEEEKIKQGKGKKSKADKKNQDVDGIVASLKHSKYIKIVKDGNDRKAIVDEDLLQSDCGIKGFSAQVSNVNLSAAEMDHNYNLRDTSEKQISILKSQLGFDPLGVHSEESWKNRLFVAFVASIIRNEIVIACREHDLDTNKVIANLKNICFVKSVDYYTFERNFPTDVRTLFKHFGLSEEYLESFHDYVNLRYADENDDRLEAKNQPRTMPELDSKKSKKNVKQKKADKQEEPKETSGEAAPIPSDQKIEQNPALANTQEIATDIGNDSQAMTSLEEKEADLVHIESESIPIEPEEKRKRGRPKGSKNKATIEREQQERERRIALGLPPEEPPKEKRGRGRPKGSKNKKTLEREQKQKEQITKLIPENAQTGKTASESEFISDRDGHHVSNQTSLTTNPTSEIKEEQQHTEKKPHKGRAKGTKNKKTLLREAELKAKIAAGWTPPEKRKPGRPKGSKNKATLRDEELDRKLSQLSGIDILGERSGSPHLNSKTVRARLRREARDIISKNHLM